MKIAFLDRDGTLVYEPPDTKLVTADDVRILPCVIDGLRALHDAGFVIVVVSNQSAAPTLATRQREFDGSQKNFEEQLAAHGIHLDHVFVCLHMPEDACTCRKPKTGMVDAFLHAHPSIDRTQSLMIGDRATDGEFAANLRVRFLHMESNGDFPSPALLLNNL